MPSDNSEKKPLCVAHSFKSQRSYGSVFTYAFLKRTPLFGSEKTLNRTDSMVSLSHRSLVTFIAEDDLPGLQNFLENKRVIVDDRDENGATALHFAASKGKLNFVRELLHHGADVNAEDNDNWTPMLCSAKEGYTEICRELLDREAQIEHRDMGGWSALMWASYKGHTETVRMLLDAGADVNAHGNYHISSLLWASGRGFTEIAKLLIQNGAKVNLGDKYGTTALVWAARKGNTEIVEALLMANSNVDTAGMYSWTALLVATKGNHVGVVSLLLPCRPNVNAVDKDGYTALTIACKEGYTEIATALLNSGAYVNIQDRSGDTSLIHAVKGGHRSVVEALIKKYADIDIPGKERKTASYNAVEKGKIPILKLLLSANPDLEIATKDGDTALLRAVRCKNAEAVQLLLDRKAKVNVSDKYGDTALHIAMRARSKAIVEILLRNPKHSQLLYRPNRAGETPYNIDMSHQKTILGQIFGSRRLNMNEDNESLLGYDLFSSALADILSEPSLSMPITVGLFAKWGSGKSFLLNKLREEMKNFARQWLEPGLGFSWVLLALVCHFALVIGLVVGLMSFSWVVGISVAISMIVLAYISLALLWCASHRYNWNYLYSLNISLQQRMSSIKIVLQVIFCHPPGSAGIDSLTAQPLRFYFTDQTRVSSTAAGENAVVQMIGSLYDSIEADFGSLSTRLYRAFRPKPAKSSSSWKFRRICCLPSIVVFEIIFFSILLICGVLTIYLLELQKASDDIVLERMTGHILLGACGALVLVTLIANSYSLSRLFSSLLFSQRSKLRRSIAKIDTVKSEGFLQALRTEVTLMTQMVKCLDAFTQQQTRLVVVVDGLDSCEQDKVLFVLDAVHVLFSDANTPFIILLAIDPHIISKAVEVNSRRLISESNIGGHDYLRNMVHLPFYLQNSGLRKVRSAQKSAARKLQSAGSQQLYPFDEPQIPRSGSIRKLSIEANNALPPEKLKIKSSGQRGSRKLKLSDSVASSLGSNLNRAGGPFDLTKMLLTDDYFSDVNPRSMRRLMNVVYVTGRLLKAFQIDFNWYHLASWINITEQWPYRTSWIILYHDSAEETIDDSISLKALYDKVRGFIPVSKDVDPLLELDRDEKKLDVFLTYHKSSLLVQDMRIFLPFTINLDPYIKKVIKEELQNAEETFGPTGWPIQFSTNTENNWATPRKPNVNIRSRHKLGVLGRDGSLGGSGQPWPSVPRYHPPQHFTPQPQLHQPLIDLKDSSVTYSPAPPLPGEFSDVRLESLDVTGVCNLVQRINDLQPSQIPSYIQIIQANNISGRVLMYCNIEDLKQVLRMSFGDWELFRMLVMGLRQMDAYPGWPNGGQGGSNSDRPPHLPPFRSSVRFQQQSQSGPRRDSKVNNSRDKTDRQSKPSAMEKQVTLEEQMICGALQTLNEEACEDVLEGQPAKRNSESNVNNNEGSTDPRMAHFRNRTSSQSSAHSLSSLNEETDMIILQSSPMQQNQWTAVGYDSQSTGSSAGGAGDTPVLTRRRNDSTTSLMNEKKPANRVRPSSTSLLLSYVGGGDGSPASVTRSVQSATAIRSHSVDEHTHHNLGGLSASMTGIAPVLRVTAPTVEQVSDDESTPLVSSVSSPESPPGMESAKDFTRPPSSLESLGLDSAPHSNVSSPRHLRRQYSLNWDDPETSV